MRAALVWYLRREWTQVKAWNRLLLAVAASLLLWRPIHPGVTDRWREFLATIGGS